jgi:hypothetical protein
MPWLMPWFLRCARAALGLMLEVKRQVQASTHRSERYALCTVGHGGASPLPRPSTRTQNGDNREWIRLANASSRNRAHHRRIPALHGWTRWSHGDARARHVHAPQLAAQPGWRRSGDDDPQPDGTALGRAAPTGSGMERSGECRVWWSLAVAGDQQQSDTWQADGQRASRCGSFLGTGLGACGNGPSITRVRD